MIELANRLAARERPHTPVAMYMKWRHLLFLHYTLDPAVVQATLPPGLTVDTFRDASGEERAWIGVVPFTMEGIRPTWGLAVPWLSAFHETNLRTYVHKDGKPGVWFYSLDAARWPACAFARATFGLPYHHAAMRLELQSESLSYGMRRRRAPAPARESASLEVSYTIGPALLAEPGSLEFWLAERYYLYSLLRGRLMRGQVYHSPYPLRSVEVLDCTSTLAEASGLPAGPWVHACYSPGVDVEVFRLQRA